MSLACATEISPPRLGIALGSNLGDSLSLLRAAVATLRAELHSPGYPFYASRIYRTEPVECPPGSPPFLNAAIELACTLPVEQIFARTQEIEVCFGRPAEHGFHTPRTLDLDLLYLGAHEIQTDQLRLPHPRIAERLFVLAPLADICPQRILPGCPQGVLARKNQLAHSQRIDVLEEPLL